MSWKRKLLPNWISFYNQGDFSYTKNLKSIKFQKTLCCSVMGLGPNVPALEQPGKKLRKNSPSHLPCLRIQVEAFSSKYLVFILLQTFSSLCFMLRLCVGWLQVLKYIEQNKSKTNASHLKNLDFCIFNSVILFLYRHLLDEYSNKLSKTKLQIDAWRWPFVHQNLWSI